MAQSSRFWTTNPAVGDGPAAGYTMTHFYEFLLRLLTTDQEASQGVLRGVGNELAVSGSSSPLSVNDGAAIVYGLFYENTSPLNLAVTTPSTGTTGGRVNLKVDWSAQTVRAVIQLNTDGVATPPALVQTAGSEWSISLATFTITTAGTITLTDVRAYCEFASAISAGIIDGVTGLSVIGRAANSTGAAAAIVASADGQVLKRNGNALEFGQVDAAGIANNAVTDAKLRDSAALSVIGRAANTSGDPADIVASADGQVLRRSGTSIAFGTVEAAGIADGAVTTDKIANDAVDDTKVGNRVPQLRYRMGGSSSDWSTPGTSSYQPGAVREQVGCSSVPVADGQTVGTLAVSFPEAFSNKPVIVASPSSDTYMPYTVCVESVTASGFTLRVVKASAASGSQGHFANWQAIGPE